MDEREAIIGDFMEWLVRAGFELSFYNPKDGVYEILDKQGRKKVVDGYFLSTAVTKEWNRDSLLNDDNSKS